MLSIDHNTFVITIPKADTVFVSTNAQTGYEIRSFDEYAFMREFADYLDSEAGQVLPNGFNHNTSVTISGVTYARAFVLLAPYTVTFENGAYQVKLVGGMNNNLLDVLNPNQVSVIPANSAGLQTVNTAGGSGATAAEVWAYSQRALTNADIIVDGIWDEPMSAHTVSGSFGEELATVADIQASAATSVLNYTSGTIVEGLLNTGSIANTVVRDGNYWTISETVLGLTVEYIFNLASAEHRPGNFTLFGRYDGKGSPHYLDLWIWNVEAAAWEQVHEKFIPSGNVDEEFSHNYTEQHIDRANNNEVKVRIVHNVTSYSTTHDFYIDAAHLTAIDVITAADIADAVWVHAIRTLTSGTSAFATPFSYKAVTNNQAASDPSPGKIKWNNATQNLATQVYIDVITDDGIDLTNYMKNIVAGSILYIQDRDDAGKFQRWTINLATDNTGWMTLNVSLVTSAGGNLANNAQAVIVYSLPATGDTCPTAQENAQAVVDHPETLTTRKYIGYQP
jgi:hypothetical protein